MTDFKFKIGDRVTERPRNIINVASSKEAMKVYARNTKQRFGTVIDTKIKANSRGARRKFIVVEWDGSGRSSEHSQMRLCAIDELPELTQSFLNGHAE